MKEQGKNVIFKREGKLVYDNGESIIKAFGEKYSKSDVLNEALNQARVEETGLNVAGVISVSKLEDAWCIEMEKFEGRTLLELMNENPSKLREYMELFVDTQLEIHSKKAPLLTSLRAKYARLINEQKAIDATTRYELLTRLESMKKHDKLCHGDFNPGNVIVGKDGKAAILDWAHATKGNASADAARTYLLFALESEERADLYMELFCRKADIARQYVEKWLPIVAAAELLRGKKEDEEFLLKWTNVVEY